MAAVSGLKATGQQVFANAVKTVNNSASPTPSVVNAGSIYEGNVLVCGRIASCGHCTAAMMLHVLKGTPLTTDFADQLVKEAQANGLQAAQCNGATQAKDVIGLLRLHGVTATTVSPWQTALDSWAGKRPIGLGISQAYAFGGDDRTVDGHWVCVFGKSGPDSYVVGDPNQKASTRGELVTYTRAQIGNAAPFATVVPTQDPITGVLDGLAAGAGGQNTSGICDIPGVGGVLCGIGGAIGAGAQDAGQAVANNPVVVIAALLARLTTGGVVTINKTIRHGPGFSGICQTLNDSETFPTFDWKEVVSPGDWFKVIFGVTEALSLRGITILAGLAFFLAAVICVMLSELTIIGRALDNPATKAAMKVGEVVL